MNGRNLSIVVVVMIAVLAGIIAYAAAGKTGTPAPNAAMPSACSLGLDGNITCALPPGATAGKTETPDTSPAGPSACNTNPDGTVSCPLLPAPGATAAKTETPDTSPAEPSACNTNPNGTVSSALPPAPRVTSVARREFDALRTRVDRLETEVRLLKAKVAVRDEDGGEK